VITYRTAKPIDAIVMARTMKDADRKEAAALHGEDIQRALIQSYHMSVETVAVDGDSGELLALGGVARAGAVGIPWLVTTQAAVRYGKRLVKDVRPVVLRWVREYGELENYVHKENLISRRWLARLGFVEEPAPYKGTDFYRFSLCAT
jgi:hypothetical protein